MGRSKKNFIIPLVVYPFDVMVSIGESNEEITSRLEALNISTQDIELIIFNDETVQGRAVMLSSNQTIIRIRRTPRTAVHYGQLQHEIFHAVAFIMERIGTPLQIMVSDEPYAYLVQYLTTEIYKQL